MGGFESERSSYKSPLTTFLPWGGGEGTRRMRKILLLPLHAERDETNGRGGGRLQNKPEFKASQRIILLEQLKEEERWNKGKVERRYHFL